MEKAERIHISENLANLISSIVCTPALLKRLELLQRLTKYDSASIDAKKYKSVFDQSSLLLDILYTRVGGYNALITALHSDRQLEPLKILLHDNYKTEGRAILKICLVSGDYDQVVTFTQSGDSNGDLVDIMGALITHDQLLHLCIRNSEQDSPEIIENKKKIIRLFKKIISADDCIRFADILKEKDSCGRTVLEQENGSAELLKCLLGN